MGILHRLAVILIISEGIIIKCNGLPIYSFVDEWRHPFLPQHLIEKILSKIGFETVKTAIREKILIDPDNILMSELLTDHTVCIVPHWFNDQHRGVYKNGFRFEFGSERSINFFFEKFGEEVKKIKIIYRNGIDFVLRNNINHDIIRTYAHSFEDFGYIDENVNDAGLWHDIIFPNVNKFEYIGDNSPNEFKLNSIFPNVVSVKLKGMIADVDCFENVRTLEELELRTNSIPEDRLKSIIANNENMEKMFLTGPQELDTMDLIAKTLTELKTFGVRHPGRNFLFSIAQTSEDREESMIHYLPSVLNFHIEFDGMSQIHENLSFDMPNLKALRLAVSNTDDQDENRIIDFVRHFRELDRVELNVMDKLIVRKCIEKIKNVAELKVPYDEDRQLLTLQQVFDNFDETSNLQKLKLLNGEVYGEFQQFEDTMRNVNGRLAISGKSTWAISYKETVIGEEYLIFKRHQP